MNNINVQELINKSLDKIEDFEVFCQQFIYLHDQTFDGWYCIKNENYADVYYQERGCKHWHIYRFHEYKKALLFELFLIAN